MGGDREFARLEKVGVCRVTVFIKGACHKAVGGQTGVQEGGGIPVFLALMDVGVSTRQQPVVI
jgi:hypothetical protein